MPEPAQSFELIDRLISDQRARWSSGDKRPIEDYIQSHPQLLENVDGLLDLIYAEYCLREESGEQVSADDYAKRFPGYFERMKPLFALHKAMGAEPTVHRRQQPLAAADGQTPSSDVRLAATVDGDHSPNAGHHMSPAGRASSSSGRLRVRCPSCHLDMEVAVDTMFTELTCHSCGSHFSLVDSSKATHVAPPLSQLGRFELIERLGVGGFGSVWKARDKELDRTVAVKIPRAGGTTAEEHEKFFREARAAAQLRHPNIVSVHEVGRDGDSVYIVSDFVRGVTLSDWLTGQRPTNREAAELCIKIADALHHAHEQGVVHRDLKPANVMIDGNGQPHLMDFGLARRDVGEVTVTMDGHILGTPAYMSPEQAQGQAHTADRRSDVYSLGVLLFQLLTGEMPFRGNVRMILHQVIYDDPPSPRKLNPHIPRDLETITLKCLDKAPSRRYQSARQLSDDLGRFLRSEPIEARPLGRLERGCRWCRRHPAIVSIIGLGIALIVTMSLALVAIYQAKQRADYNTQLAEQNEATVRRTLHLLQQLFKTADPVFGSAVGFRQSDDAAKISLGEVLNRAVPTVLEQVKQDQPAVGVEVLYTLGDVYRSVGVYDAAEKILSQARESAKQLPDTSDAKALAEFHWGWYCHDIGRYKEAEASYERSRELRLSNYSENSLEVAEIDFNRAWLRADLRKPVEAIQLFRRVLDIRRSRLEDTSFEVQTTAVALKILLLSQDKHKDAMMVEILVGGRPDAMVELIEVFRQGKMLRDKKKYDEALVQYLKLYEGVKQRLNPGHPLLVFLQVDLAGLYREMGNMPAAEDLMREAIKGSKMLFDNNPKLAKPLNEFAHALARRGDVDEAARMYRRALAAAKDHDPVLEGMIQKSLDALPKSQASSEGKKSAENEEKKSADRAHGKSN